MIAKAGNVSIIMRSEGLLNHEGEEIVELPGEGTCIIGPFPEETTLVEAFTTITAPNGVWAGQSDQPPAWVESDSEGLATLLSEHFGCPIGRPAEWPDNADLEGE